MPGANAHNARRGSPVGFDLDIEPVAFVSVSAEIRLVTAVAAPIGPPEKPPAPVDLNRSTYIKSSSSGPSGVISWSGQAPDVGSGTSG